MAIENFRTRRKQTNLNRATGVETVVSDSVTAVGVRVDISKSAIVQTAAHNRGDAWWPPTPMSRQTDKTSWPHGKIVRNSTWPTRITLEGNLRNELAVVTSPTLPSSTGLQQAAVNKCLQKLKNSSVNLAQAFAERKQTCNLVASNASRIAQAMRALRKGRLDLACRALGTSARKPLSTKDIGNQWLELQYGWKPLVSDVYGAVQALHDADNLDRKRYGYNVKSTAARNLTGTVKSTDFNLSKSVVNKSSVGYMVRLDYYLENNFVSSLSSLGVLDPALLAWELVPYSFVVDWFLPVGDFLQSLNGDAGFSFKGGSWTRRALAEADGTWQRDSAGPESIIFAEAAAKAYYKEVIRGVYENSPTAGFTGLKNPFSYVHLANSLALLRGAFGR